MEFDVEPFHIRKFSYDSQVWTLGNLFQIKIHN